MSFGPFGLCLSDGNCGLTKSTQTVHIVNSALASAYHRNAFRCSNWTKASTDPSSYCGCADAGITDARTCLLHKTQMETLTSQICNKGGFTLLPEEEACLCNSSGAGSKLNVDHSSLIASQLDCQNAETTQHDLNANFPQDVADTIERNMTLLGAHLGTDDKTLILQFATKIAQNIDRSIIDEIAKMVTATPRKDCGGLQWGQTRYSHFNHVLLVMSTRSAIAEMTLQIHDKVKASFKRKDNGAKGFFTSPAGIALVLIVGIFSLMALLLVLWLKYKH